MEARVRGGPFSSELLDEGKGMGLGDEHIASLAGVEEHRVRTARRKVTYKMVDTCGGEFEARTPYYYSTHEAGDEVVPLPGTKVLIVGAGPVPIAQGGEFDYCTLAGVFPPPGEG